MEQIFGFIERIVFYNYENGFTVARVKQPRKTDLTTVVGVMPAIQPGENIRLLGNWKSNQQHGIQFEVKECFVELPADVVGIQKYLESGMVKGIGPIYAKRIVEKFGDKTLEVIDKNPERLIEVSGIGEKRLETIQACWQAHKDIRELMVFLQKHQVTPTLAQKIYRTYKEESLERLKENPYALAREIKGVGFKSADQLAQKLGFPKDATQRIDCGIEYVLLELADDGHTCYPKTLLCQEAEKILEVPIKPRLEALIVEGRVVKETIANEEMIWLKSLWLSEKGIVREIERLQKGNSQLRTIDGEKAVEWVQKELNMELASKQKEAILRSFTNKCHIITGGPGTGKSTITKAILRITEKLTRRILLAAPTGRAAKRMSEITRRPASTIHALLQYDFSNLGFKKNQHSPLECDLLIIDEASMIDTYLMYHLLKAIPSHARFLLIGDDQQLPSVGPGNVLKDLKESEQLSVTELNEIFRQAADSKIITNAHRVNQGLFPDFTPSQKNDFFFIKKEMPEEVLETITSLVSRRLPTRYRFNPIEEIQVLAPMKKGVIGTENLNSALQTILNPQGEFILHGGNRFGVGDKVMQTRNDYQKEVFNGDIGKISKIDREAEEITVVVDGKEVVYAFTDLDSLVLAYAVSVHKSQGSEYPCVVIPIHTTHFMMLRRNLLYTAITRGKRLVVLVGLGKAIGIAVSTDDVTKRYTGLKHYLMNSLSLPHSLKPNFV